MLHTPLWYHPSTVVLLDDQKKFVDFLHPHIDPAFLCVAETDHQAALKYLLAHTYDMTDDFGCPMHLDTFNIGEIRNALAKKDKLHTVTVLVVDRHMPGMDGLEFCRVIREDYSLPIKLILLTGATTAQEAINALNAGKIDAYIEKRGAEEVAEKVNNLVYALAWKQFAELGQVLITRSDCPLPQLSDASFNALLQGYVKEKDIIEFCIFNGSGSFLLLDKNKKTKMLLVCSDADFETAYDIAENTNAPHEVLQSLKNRTHYPMVFSNIIPVSIAGDAWRDIMVTVEPLESSQKNKIFYRWVDEPETVF